MKTIKAMILTASMLSGCAAFDAPQVSMIIPQGSSVCINTSGGPVSAAKCEELDRIMQSLNTPEMTATIKRAQCSVQKELC